jgi:hypothetical protein
MINSTTTMTAMIPNTFTHRGVLGVSSALSPSESVATLMTEHGGKKRHLNGNHGEADFAEHAVPSFTR